MHMKYLWAALNFNLVGLALLGGYNSMNPDELRHTNPDPVLCLIVLLIMPLFAVVSVAYSLRRWKSDPLNRPSWTRNPFNWWGDPLQSLFVSTCIMGAMAAGSAVQHPAFGSVGFWILGVYLCFTIGLLVGQLLVYRIFRQRIAPIT
jgi:tellurite resistance protein TehA-like permease